jgi:hypothetical protein
MATIITRAGKGSPLTNAELDANFVNLNTQLGGALFAALNLSDLTDVPQARTNLGLGNVENKSSATIRGELTSTNVTTALGFTPYNATNPAGYITSSALSPYLTSSTAASTYQTISGMSSYLTTASAASTYQTLSGMSSYLTTSSAASTYLALVGGTLTGSLTAPALVPNGSSTPTNGVFLPAANAVGISSNSVERVRIDGNGLVTATDVSGKLTIGRFSSSLTDSYFALGSGSTGYTFQNAGGSANLMRISSGGLVTIGSTGATYSNSSLAVSVGVTAYGTFPIFQTYNSAAATDKKFWRMVGGSTGDLTFETVNDAYTASTARFAIFSTGGISTPSADVFGTITGHRSDNSAEGGELQLRRASDDGTGWSIDVFGTGSTPSLRFGNANAIQGTWDGAGQLGIGFTPNASQGQLQVWKNITGGTPATSGTTDANQVAMIGGGGVGLGIGLYPSGAVWMQPRSFSNFAGNYNMVLLPNGGNLAVGTTALGYKFNVGGGRTTLVSDSNQYALGLGYANGVGLWLGADSGNTDLIVSDGGGSERLRVISNGTLQHSGGQYRTALYTSGTVTPATNKWYRLCYLDATNAGQAVEFLFTIPGTHVLFRVKFSKTTSNTQNYGGGILEVELLGSYLYGFAHPYKWRVVEGGTNAASAIDIQFPNANGSAFAWRVQVLNSWSVSALHATFPLTDMGTSSGAGATNYGVVIGDGAGADWTRQWFKLNSVTGKFAYLDNNLTMYGNQSASTY